MPITDRLVTLGFCLRCAVSCRAMLCCAVLCVLPCLPAVFQILRGAEMIFAALFAVSFLHRPLNRWHYAGVALCMVRCSNSMLLVCFGTGAAQ